MVEQAMRNFALFSRHSHDCAEIRPEYRCRSATIDLGNFKKLRRVSTGHENSNPRACVRR